MAGPRAYVIDASRNAARHARASGLVVLAGVEVVRHGRVEPLLHPGQMLSSATGHWSGIAVEEHSTPPCVISQHTHIENFLHVVLRGSVKCEVRTRGKSLRFFAHPGTTFILPRGTVDEVRWDGPVHRVAAAIHPSLLIGATDEAAQQSDVELTEHWNLTDPHITAVLRTLTTDLAHGSPAGQLFGESLANALAVYLLRRHAVRRVAPAEYRGGLPGYRLKRVLDYIGDNLAEDLSLSQLSALVGMSPHYFAELFTKSTGQTPHRYVLTQRIVRAKEALCDPGRSVIEAGLDAGFQNPSHFARVFRKFVGTSPSRFQSEVRSGR
jgi:AraC family transcriptional regulator